MSSELTLLLNAARDGDEGSRNAAYERVYGELRRLAGGALAPGRASTMQATALVHEVWLKLASKASPWESRGHYFSIAAKAMRCILVDHVRHRRAKKRNHERRVTLDEIAEAVSEKTADLLELDRVLHELGELDARKLAVVELRFFAGLTIDETARVLEISVATVERDWMFAKAWLKRALSQ